MSCCVMLCCPVLCCVCRMLHALDSICLTNSIFISLLVVKVLGAPMSWLQWLQAVLYAVASAIQLLVMHQHKQFYQRHRFKVRLLALALLAMGMGRQLYHSGSGCRQCCVGRACDTAAGDVAPQPVLPAAQIQGENSGPCLVDQGMGCHT